MQTLEVGTAAGLSAFTSSDSSGGGVGSGGGVWDFWNDGYGSGGSGDSDGSGGSGGDGSGGGSGGGLDTSTYLYSWPSVAAPGDPVDMVAVVTDQNGDPITAGESVEFAYVGTNPYALGWGATDDNGYAEVTTTSLPTGIDPIQAGYPGDGYYMPSVSYADNVAITGVAITNLPANNTMAEGSSVALGSNVVSADGQVVTASSYTWTVSDDGGETIDTGSARPVTPSRRRTRAAFRYRYRSR